MGVKKTMAKKRGGIERTTPRMREFLLWVKRGEPRETFSRRDLHIFHRAKRLGFLDSKTVKEEGDILPVSNFQLSKAGRAALDRQ